MDNHVSRAGETRTSQKTVLDENLDDKICLDPEIHQYQYKNGTERRILTSVSNVLNTLLYDNFNAKEASTRRQAQMSDINETFKNVDMRSEAILAEWNYQAAFGTSVHAIVEKFFHGISLDEALSEACELYDPLNFAPRNWRYEATKQFFVKKFDQRNFSTDAVNRIRQFERVYGKFFSQYKFCATEYIVYDLETEIAGCIDGLFWSDREQRKVILVDWKTNKDLATYGLLVRNPKSPFFKLKRSKLNRYQCQLHIYAAILEKNYDVTVEDCFIVHLGPYGYYKIFENTPYTECDCFKTIFC